MAPQRDNRASAAGNWGLVLAAILGVAAFAWLLSGSLTTPGQSANVATEAVAAETVGYLGPDVQTPEPSPATPLPATALPETGIRLHRVEDLGAKLPGLALSPATSPQFVNLSTDGAVVAGLSVVSGKPGVFGHVALVDLTTNTVSDLAEVADVVAPRVSAGFVIWSDQGRLSVYDRKSQTSRELKLEGLARDPDLSGSVVVFENLVDGQTTGLVAYDLATDAVWQVVASTTQAKAYRPLISGNWVVFESWSLAPDGQLVKTLRVANLRSQKVVDLATLPTIQGYMPIIYAIHAPWVVWAEWGEAPGLQLYNVDTGERREARPKDCSQNGYPGNPSSLRITDSLIVFSGCYQLMGYSLIDGAFFTVPVPANEAGTTFDDWALSGNRLTWALLHRSGDAQETNLYTGVFNLSK